MYWSLIGLQCGVSFCCTRTWISCMHTHTPSALRPPPTQGHPTPPGHHRAPSWAPCVMQRLRTSYLFQCTRRCHPPAPIHPSHPLPPCPGSALHILISFPALKIASSVPFLSIPHKGINILYCSSIPDLLHLVFPAAWQTPVLWNTFPMKNH